MTKPDAAGALIIAGAQHIHLGGGHILQTLFYYIWVESLGELEDFKLGVLYNQVYIRHFGRRVDWIGQASVASGVLSSTFYLA